MDPIEGTFEIKKEKRGVTGEMEIRKEQSGTQPGQVEQRDLEEINALSKGELKAEDVYVFSLRLCDNEVDRDFQRFDREALERLGELFVGKSGLFDHQWSAEGQTARIYRTEVCREDGAVTAAGDDLCYLKGWAYMLRSDKNADLIAEIEARHQKGGLRGMQRRGVRLLHLRQHRSLRARARPQLWREAVLPGAAPPHRRL